MKEIALVGYSGHAFVAAEILNELGYKLIGYFEMTQKEFNPYNLKYLGYEWDINDSDIIRDFYIFPSIGDNYIRKKVSSFMNIKGFSAPVIISTAANVSGSVKFGQGCLICRGASINPLVKAGIGVIFNTGSIIDHECFIGDFVHIGPGAVIAGNVKIGHLSFIGANSTVIQGITIGKNATIGAGAVILSDVPDNAVIVGNPGKVIKYNNPTDD